MLTLPVAVRPNEQSSGILGLVGNVCCNGFLVLGSRKMSRLLFTQKALYFVYFNVDWTIEQ